MRVLKEMSLRKKIIGAVGFVIGGTLMIVAIAVVVISAGLIFGHEVENFGAVALIGSSLTCALGLFISYWLGRKDKNEAAGEVQEDA